METILSALVIPASLLLFGSSLSWFMASQFTGVRKLIHQEIGRVEANVLQKLEYHEQHDDQRFNTVNNNLWEIRIRNASKDKEMAELEEFKKKFMSKGRPHQ